MRAKSPFKLQAVKSAASLHREAYTLRDIAPTDDSRRSPWLSIAMSADKAQVELTTAALQ